MVRKSFKVTVDGETFNVEVEEVKTNEDLPRYEEQKKVKDTSQSGLEKKQEALGAADEKKEPYHPKANTSVDSTPKEAPAAERTSSAHEEVVAAPMPGSIIDVKVAEGDMVSKDQVLIILEAMKMENEVTSPVSGKVTQVMVSKGDSVNSKDPMIKIEA